MNLLAYSPPGRLPPLAGPPRHPLPPYGVSLRLGGLSTQEIPFSNAVLPGAAHLPSPCQHGALFFDSQRAASVEVIRLPDGEVALLHKQGGRAYFLGQSRQAVQNGPPHPDVLQPSLHHGYPGRSATGYYCQGPQNQNYLV
ncbi:hypothetical protein GWK47_034176 [Chionoecetes opilio]|uniref:Uncharacterized protein n=1 Tax=Chionoecetes opilio TaxID=41210 RepID=A0A8J4YV00_CHIOP|nr:hypothetical protein GWK47_034176 [Chionoecetes opilio]